jgi:hypothetical protein
MTKRKLPQAPDPIDPAAQALAILKSLEAWCSAAPARGFRCARVDGRWQATLLEIERRASSGDSLADALSQIATVASLETST